MEQANRHLSAFVASFRRGTLPRSDWSHETHLIICWALFREHGSVDATVDDLVPLIHAYNEGTGQPPDAVPCHQTITRYFVEAVAALGDPALDEVLVHPWCSRRAPFDHWSPALLASAAARHGWAEPDLVPLPWSGEDITKGTAMEPDAIEPDAVTMARTTLAKHLTEPIEAAVMVHRGPDTGGGGLKRVFGQKTVASKLRHTNYLVMTPTHLRVFPLGGRTGLVPKDEIAAWRREDVTVTSTIEERSSYFASTGSSYEYRVHRLHLTGPDLDLTVDVRADGGLELGDVALLEDQALLQETDPDVREAMEGLRESAAEVASMVDAIIAGTG